MRLNKQTTAERAKAGALDALDVQNTRGFLSILCLVRGQRALLLPHPPLRFPVGMTNGDGVTVVKTTARMELHRCVRALEAPNKAMEAVVEVER